MPGLSGRVGGGGFLLAIRAWCACYEVRMKADIKSSLPEIKASKSVKGSGIDTGNLKLACFYFNFWSSKPPGPPIKMFNLYTNDGPWALKHEFFDLQCLWSVLSSSVWARSRLSTSVQPPITNFPDNPALCSYKTFLRSGTLTRSESGFEASNLGNNPWLCMRFLRNSATWKGLMYPLVFAC